MGSRLLVGIFSSYSCDSCLLLNNHVLLEWLLREEVKILFDVHAIWGTHSSLHLLQPGHWGHWRMTALSQHTLWQVTSLMASLFKIIMYFVMVEVSHVNQVSSWSTINEKI